eukprot:4718919-Pyramimonas_sp.AAC.1
MQNSKFPLEAPMGILEALVQTAMISSLGTGKCSICTLRRELSGSEEGLGCPNTMTALEYIGGGIAMSNRRLDEDSPASPAPGALLIPPRVIDD